MEIELRREIYKILKEQEKESRKSRRRDNASISYLWQLIQPQNYESLVVSLRRKDMELFDNLYMRLYHDQKRDLYNQVI